MATASDSPMKLQITLRCGCVATFAMPGVDEAIVLQRYDRAGSCPDHPSPPAPGTALAGVGPWWTWDANLYNRTATTAAKLWTWEPEHLYVLSEQYLFLEGQPNVPFGPILRGIWLGHVPVAR